MSRLSRIAERSATFSNPSEWLVQALTGGKTKAGVTVNVRKALGLAPYWRGVHLLSGAVGMMPCKVYRRKADGQREQVSPTSRPWQLLHDRPNEEQAADEFWALVESHLDTWGNSFVYKERGGDGRIANLWPLDPCRFSVGRREDGSRYFMLDGKDEFTSVDILHVRGLGNDGLVGYSPIHMHRQTLGSALARQEFEGAFWANDATPGVVLIHPGKPSWDAIDRIREKFDEHHRGSGKARRTAVLGEAIQLEQMTMPLRDAQFIEQARYGATEQALILGIPPYMVAGDTGDNSLTYSTTEAQSLDLLKWTLSPRLVRLQNSVSSDPDLMPTNWYAEFETGAVLRGTTKERYEAWATAPHLLIDEMRALDNLPPLPDGAGQVLSHSTTPPAGAPALTVGKKPADGSSE